LRKELLARIGRTGLISTPGLVVIDEVQKVPALLDEVHWLIENSHFHFCLCGSSARKLKQTGANLLGGRALRYELFGLTSAELGTAFSLETILNHGYLPRHYLSDNPEGLVRAYIADYLTEEIAQEGLIRSIPKFSDFLRAAALSDTEIVNYKNIADDCAVAPPTAKEHYQILVDTLLGSYLPAYTRKQKRKVITAAKFYMADVAVVNQLAKRGRIILGSEQSGKAFESWIHHEIRAYRHYSEKFYDLSYWRLAGTQHEVDFILNDMQVAIEVKTAHRIAGHHLKSLYQLIKDNPKVSRVMLVCRETKRRIEGGKIEIVPYQEFIAELWGGEII